jgi:protoporphyrin/coproporphyrin ferrochelatase
VAAEGRRKVAVVLFNLGGPDRPSAIRPFLLNLFRDPAILRVPFFVRPVLARVIARSRLQPARDNYSLLGGSSPLLDLTRAQATALQAALSDLHVECFIAMRYWHPFSDAAAQAVCAWGPDEVVLLPLYPQYSTTTTASSVAAWHEAAAKAGLVAPTHSICCYPTDGGFVASVAGRLRAAYAAARSSLAPGARLRVLFSAHGLPASIIARGDPYQWQVEQTAAAVMSAWGEAEIDWVVCYQSRATPQRWIEPSTIAEIERAARDGVAIVVVPIAFVSEHSETLVELDIEYRHLADRLGVPGYSRVPVPGTDPVFIGALADAVRRARACGVGTHSHTGSRVCPGRYTGCPYRLEDRA